MKSRDYSILKLLDLSRKEVKNLRVWLKDLRIEKGLTMKEVGARLGISESYYCAIEAGDRQKKMDVTLAAGLAAVFGRPIAEIIALETASAS